jgi:tRNA(Ile)-lysidine synthase
MAADRDSPITSDEAAALFQDLAGYPAVLLAVSGGPDSTALMLLMARWRGGRAPGPKLIAATVDHGLRAESAEEARAVAKLARTLGIPHRVLRWTGKKPSTGIQEAARSARYQLLAQATRRAGITVIATAHTLDDQAETVLFRLARGSGLAGIGGMRRTAPVPGAENLTLIRPLLGVPKSRLIATLQAENIAFADDPSNCDPRFARPRLRGLMPKLAEEGLDAERFARLAERATRAHAALDEIAAATFASLAKREKSAAIRIAAADFAALPDEIGLRLLTRVIAETGDEGPVELGKLETLHAVLREAFGTGAPFRRSLAGALVTLSQNELTIERAPPRRSRTLTTRRGAGAKRRKGR